MPFASLPQVANTSLDMFLVVFGCGTGCSNSVESVCSRNVKSKLSYPRNGLYVRGFCTC